MQNETNISETVLTLTNGFERPIVAIHPATKRVFTTDSCTYAGDAKFSVTFGDGWEEGDQESDYSGWQYVGLWNVGQQIMGTDKPLPADIQVTKA